MADEADTTLHEWLSVVLKRGVVIVKNRTEMKCSCEETFGSLVRKVAAEFQEERVKRIVISTDEKFIVIHEVSVDAPPIGVCKLSNCKHYCIYFESSDSASSSAAQVP